MHVVIAGASGFIGTPLVSALRGSGHRVTTLVRRAPTGPDEHAWNPDDGVLPIAALDGADAIVNLCGAGPGDRRWTARRKKLLRSSRLLPTALLARAATRQGVPVLLNASAVGYYGDRGANTVTEADRPGTGFLAELVRDWEAATGPAAAGGVRVVQLRTGLVLGPGGGMLPRLSRLTRFGLGGRLASGDQYWPWISVTDHIAAIVFALQEDIAGPVNLTAPTPVTNAEFTRRLGEVLSRPTPWVIPAFALHAALGGFAGEIIGGQRAVPRALQQAGFEFLHADLRTALRAWARP